MSEMSELECIQEGDYVALMHGGWSRDVSKLKVTRTTPTRIYVGDVAYTRRGYRVGSSDRGYGGEWITKWRADHDEMVAATRLRRSQRDLAQFPWQTVDQATADAVLALIKTQEPQQ